MCSSQRPLQRLLKIVNVSCSENRKYILLRTNANVFQLTKILPKTKIIGCRKKFQNENLKGIISFN